MPYPYNQTLTTNITRQNFFGREGHGPQSIYYKRGETVIPFDEIEEIRIVRRVRQEEEPCAIREFFKRNPDGVCCLYCSCSRCSPRC